MNHSLNRSTFLFIKIVSSSPANSERGDQSDGVARRTVPHVLGPRTRSSAAHGVDGVPVRGAQLRRPAQRGRREISQGGAAGEGLDAESCFRSQANHSRLHPALLWRRLFVENPTMTSYR